MLAARLVTLVAHAFAVQMPVSALRASVSDRPAPGAAHARCRLTRP
ncbi:hypothetical protein ACFH04_01630 [Streptomyces noboritoensis]|uniref:Uncharacterized protein n=1 Tax=Streptomyces noboritoensis TaxID=67337 RepID=A0ABV6T9I7_9ACTN